MPTIVGLLEHEGIYGEIRSVAAFFLRTPQWVDQVSVSAINNAYTIPTGATKVVINGLSNYYVRADSAAVIPAAGKTDGTGSFLNPTQLDVRGITTLNFIGDVDYVTIAVFS